ncbi:MAG: hypothetical protein ACI4MQ_01835 [Candidatus Coproplasma sp.]
MILNSKDKNDNNKKGLIRKLFEDIDENWFSFLSGVVANIPISLLFCFQSWGNNIYANAFFILQWVAFALSVGLLICSFNITILKISINKEAQERYEKWVLESKTQSVKAQNKKRETVVEEKKEKIKPVLIAFVILAALTLVAIGILWWLYNCI